MWEEIASQPERSLPASTGFDGRTGDWMLVVRYATALREHWIYVLVSTALAIAGGAAYVLMAEERYEATTDVFVAQVADDSVSQLPVLDESTQGLSLLANARLTKNVEVTSRVRERLGLRIPPSAVADLIRVTPREASGTLSITGIGGSPAAAATIANAFAEALVAVRTRRFQEHLQRAIRRTSTRLRTIANPASVEAESLSNRLADYRALTNEPDPGIEVLGAAVAPSSPVWPRPIATLLGVGLVGLLLGTLVAVALELANPIVIRTDALAEPGGPPILARLPTLTHAEARQLLLHPEEGSPQLREKARSLSPIVSGLLPSWSQPRTLLVLSAGDDAGTPTVAAALAGGLARSGMSVALVDFDLERGPLAPIVDGMVGVTPARWTTSNVSREPSVGQILMARNPRALLDAVHPISQSHRLRVLVARDDRHLPGWVPPGRVSALAQELKRRVHAVVISAPPLPASESWALLGSADVVIVVVAIGHTTHDQLTSLRQALALSDVRPVGYVALERSSLLTRISDVASRLRPSPRRAAA